MPRAMKGAARRQSKVRWFKKAKGSYGSRSRLWRRIKETVIRAGVQKYKHRRLLKRNYRRLWIIRINAACRMRNFAYSRLIAGLKAACIDLNRKMLSEIAIADPKAFDLIVEQAQAALKKRHAA